MSRLLTFFSLVISVAFLAGVLHYASFQQEPFYFIETDVVLEKYSPMVAANESIKLKDQLINEKMKVYEDSLSRLIDSLSIRRGNEESLLSLLNLESNVQRHKMIDSTSKVASDLMKNAVESFNAIAAEFCKKNNIHLLFGTTGNFIVYGSHKKADLTEKFIKYLEK